MIENVLWRLAHAQAVSERRVRRSFVDECHRVIPMVADLVFHMTDDMGEAFRHAPGMPDGFLPLDSPLLNDKVREVDPMLFGLWSRGPVELLRERTVGIIGSRHPRPASMAAARQIAATVARAGVTVVSGMAMGIDGIAHRAAVDAGGTTIAVLGSGCGAIYPSQNRRFAEQIVAKGCGLLLSEHPDRWPAKGFQFAERNRVIAALSDLLVVIQARASSGSMITANYATSLGVEVGVVPSYLGDFEYEGSLGLLREGARVILDGDMALRAMEIDPGAASERHVFGTMLDAPRTAEELAGFLEMKIGDVFSELVRLEIGGLVVRTPDGRYLNADQAGRMVPT